MAHISQSAKGDGEFRDVAECRRDDNGNFGTLQDVAVRMRSCQVVASVHRSYERCGGVGPAWRIYGGPSLFDVTEEGAA